MGYEGGNESSISEILCWCESTVSLNVSQTSRLQKKFTMGMTKYGYHITFGLAPYYNEQPT